MNYLNFRLLALDSIYVASYLATGFHRRDAVAALKKRPRNVYRSPAADIADVASAPMHSTEAPQYFAMGPLYIAAERLCQ